MEDEATKATRCPTCGRAAFADGSKALKRVVGGHTFEGTVPAQVCPCGEALISHQALGHFEAAVARALVTAGAADGDTLKWLRKTAGLRAADLADLLGVTAKTVSRWETGETPIDRATLLTLGRLADDAGEGRSATADALRAMARPPTKAPRTVSLGAV